MENSDFYSGNGRNGDDHFKRGDAVLLVALASGLSIRKAAAKAGVCEKTVSDRLKDPAFREELNGLRNQMVSEAVGRLSAAMSEASVTLRRLLKARSEMARL